MKKMWPGKKTGLPEAGRLGSASASAGATDATTMDTVAEL